MTIKKAGKTQLSFEVSKSSAILDFSNPSEIKFKVTSEKGNTDISKPGEYEFGTLDLLVLESKKDKMEAKIDLISYVESSSVGVVCVFSDVEVEKKQAENLSNSYVLLVSGVSEKYLKRYIETFDPVRVIMTGDAAWIESIKKDLGSQNITEDTKYKFEDSDFEGIEESATTFHILN